MLDVKRWVKIGAVLALAYVVVAAIMWQQEYDAYAAENNAFNHGLINRGGFAPENYHPYKLRDKEILYGLCGLGAYAAMVICISMVPKRTN